MAPLTITILGASPAAPNINGACSSYLARHDDTSLLIDCGPGSAGRIGAHVAVNSLDGVVISHLHPDHYLDLIQLYYLLRFGPPRPATLSKDVPLLVPPGGRDFLNRLGQLIGDRSAMLEDVFAIDDYHPGHSFPIGGLRVTFHPVQHYIPSHAVRVESPSGASLVFSSDVAPCPQIVEAARHADVLLCESALLDASQDQPDPALRGHMSAAEAATTAHDAGARRLLITHFRDGPRNDEHHLTTARQNFAGQVDLAREGATYTVG